MSKQEALEVSYENKCDIYVIATEKDRYICQLGNYSKYKYIQKKKNKIKQQQSKTEKIKKIRLGANIDDNDMKIKGKNIINFLNDKCKVKIYMILYGRQIANRSDFFLKFDRIIDILKSKININIYKTNNKKINSYEILVEKDEKNKK